MSSYWKNRIANAQWTAYNNTAKYQKQMLALYRKANAEIEQELFLLEKRIAKDGVISRSTFFRGNYLSKINHRYVDVLKTLGDDTEAIGIRSMSEAGKSLFGALSEATGIPVNYDEFSMQRLMQVKWAGSNFSSRVWQNQKKLGAVLNSTLKNGIHQGKPTAQIALELDNAMHKGLNRAIVLVRTETMHHLNQANMEAMRQMGAEEVEEVVTLDERTSSTCKVHDGKIWSIDRAPFLPRHPNCRCVLVPHMDVGKLAEEFDSGENKLQDENHGDLGYNKIEEANYDIALSKVIDHGKKTGTEGLMWLDLKGNEIIPFQAGNKNSVNIAKNDFNYLKSLGKNTVISLHNHPESSSFSPSDMSIACRLECVKEMRVIAHDGTKYYLEIGSGKRPEFHIIDDEYHKIKNTLNPKYQKIFDKTKDSKSTWKEHSHEINEKLAETFGWGYRREIP